jgi:hypothetical protein
VASEDRTAASPSGLCPCGQPLGHDERAYWTGNVQVWFTVPGHTVDDAAERMEWFASRVKEALNDAGIYPKSVRPNSGMGSTALSLIPELSQ